ncbi:hypothetical protein EDB92DRAFT_1812495 [Lactarius akahatsu]|uniref:Uncharacterized protein n=1 Tax=Lactarius akahatsu TaxID=416441 RepID=A0AAD4LQH0_9AGAM|nr:hypothetical protein EDB92DRAFT_1812495 [Lactarius akahatsu]
MTMVTATATGNNDRDSDSNLDSNSSDNNEKSTFEPLASKPSDMGDSSTQAIKSDMPLPPGKKLKGAHKKAVVTRAATKATSCKNKRANKLIADQQVLTQSRLRSPSRRKSNDAYASEEQKVQSSVVNCEDQVPCNAKPTSQGPSHVPAITPSRSKSSIVLPLTSNSTRLSVPSVLTSNINIVSHGSLGLTKVKAKPLDVTLLSEGGLSDADETNGREWEAAVKSPPKGKRRATNNS